MARPITNIETKPIDLVKEKEENKGDLVDALIERKTSIEALIALVEKMEVRGIWDLLNGLVGQGDKVLGVVMHELNQPNVSNALEHLMDLGTFVGKLDTKKLTGFVERINRGLNQAEKAAVSGEQVSLIEMMRILRDPDINRSIAALIGFLKGAGANP